MCYDKADEIATTRMAEIVVPAINAELQNQGHMCTRHGDTIWLRGIRLLLEYDRDMYTLDLWRLTASRRNIMANWAKKTVWQADVWHAASIKATSSLFHIDLAHPFCFESLYDAIRQHGEIALSIGEAAAALADALDIPVLHAGFEVTHNCDTITIHKPAHQRLLVDVQDGWQGFPCCVLSC